MGDDPTATTTTSTQTPAGQTPPTSRTANQEQPEQVKAAPPNLGQADLGKVRDLVLAANPDVVPEMIAGDSFDSLLASVEPAKAAYKRIVEAVGTSAQTQQQAAPSVGTAGAPGRSISHITIEALSPSAKIAEGVRRRNSRSERG